MINSLVIIQCQINSGTFQKYVNHMLKQKCFDWNELTGMAVSQCSGVVVALYDFLSKTLVFGHKNSTFSVHPLC